MKRLFRFLPVLLLLGAMFSLPAFAKLPPRLTVDTPLNGMYITRVVRVKGWALNQSGVSVLCFYFDGRLIGRTSCGVSRGDVARTYPGYPNAAASGFSIPFGFDLSTLREGSHTMKVVAMGRDGSSASATYTMRYRRAMVCIDGPAAGTQVFDSAAVQGWALDAANVRQVNVFVDGAFVSAAQYGVQRGDVARACPGFACGPSCGYGLTVDFSRYAPGGHTITVQEVAEDGHTAASSVRVVKAPTLLCVDTRFGLVQDSLTVDGWALAAEGVKEVDFALDGKSLGSASANVPRGDVQRAFPGYRTGDAGYHFVVGDPSRLPSGTHTLTVTAVGNDGSTASQSFSITKLKPLVCIDSPANGASCAGSVHVGGWALSASGVRHVYVTLDNAAQPADEATLGGSRPDVQNAVNGQGGYKDGARCGYDYFLSLSGVSAGAHTITVRAVGADGESVSATVGVSIGNVTVSTKSYAMKFSDFVSQEMTQAPTIRYNGHWTTAAVVNGQKGYYIDGKTSTFTADASVYAMIEQKVEYYANPQNFINDPVGVYQFLKLSWVDGFTASDLNSVLGGVLAGQGQTFLDAAKANNLNPLYLVGKAVLETGNGTSNLAKGIVVNGKTCYNFFGIGAVDSNPDGGGSQKAYNSGWYDTGDGKGANSGVYKAIFGGASWIASSYINRQPNPQDTLYLERWNPMNLSHQYATDVTYAYSQAAYIKQCFDTFKNVKLCFEIPMFQN